MGELSLSEQDVDLLITALELLLKRVQGRKDFVVLQASIHTLVERLDSLDGEERAQAIAAIQKALSEIAAELESHSSEADEAGQR